MKKKFFYICQITKKKHPLSKRMCCYVITLVWFVSLSFPLRGSTEDSQSFATTENIPGPINIYSCLFFAVCHTLFFLYLLCEVQKDWLPHHSALLVAWLAATQMKGGQLNIIEDDIIGFVVTLVLLLCYGLRDAFAAFWTDLRNFFVSYMFRKPLSNTANIATK